VSRSLAWLAALLVCGVLGAATPAPTPAPTWPAFWRAVQVDPPPPADFLDVGPYRGKVLNLSNGRLTDATVRQWIEGDLRRGQGDAFAGNTLRRDIAQAGMLGPPGLNGTTESIDAAIANGVDHIEAGGYAETVAAAVIWITKEQQLANPGAGYTDYVIVHVRRMSGKPRMRVFKDGKRQPFGTAPKPGELRWQLDTGHFVSHPVLGPLWYQKTGWSCKPDDGTAMGEICGRVTP